MLSGRLLGFIPQTLAHFEQHILTLQRARPYSDLCRQLDLMFAKRAANNERKESLRHI
jgi:hypothetical protein